MLKIYIILAVLLVTSVYSQDGTVKTYYGKGKISSRVSFVDDVLEGSSFWYFENGNLETEKKYLNGTLNGFSRSYHEIGLLKEEINYTDGILDGISKYYYPNGALKEVRKYDKGKLIDVQKIDFDSNYIAPFSAYEAGMGKNSLEDNDILCEVDVCPQPIGGIAEIQKNLIYPELAKQFNLEGNVLISTIINLKGEPTKIKVIKGIGLGCDEAAVDAVKKTKFIPGEKKKESIVAEITFGIEFKLKQIDEANNNIVLDESQTLPHKEVFKFISCDTEICPKPVGGINEMLKKLRYPPQAKRNNISGEVEIEAKINELGFVIGAEIVNGLGYGCDEAAKTTVIKTEFEPAIQNGKAVESIALIRVPFILEEEKKD